jgi:hypothetical protein
LLSRNYKTIMNIVHGKTFFCHIILQ